MWGWRARTRPGGRPWDCSWTPRPTSRRSPPVDSSAFAECPLLARASCSKSELHYLWRQTQSKKEDFKRLRTTVERLYDHLSAVDPLKVAQKLRGGPKCQAQFEFGAAETGQMRRLRTGRALQKERVTNFFKFVVRFYQHVACSVCDADLQKFFGTRDGYFGAHLVYQLSTANCPVVLSQVLEVLPVAVDLLWASQFSTLLGCLLQVPVKDSLAPTADVVGLRQTARLLRLCAKLPLDQLPKHPDCADLCREAFSINRHLDPFGLIEEALRLAAFWKTRLLSDSSFQEYLSTPAEPTGHSPSPTPGYEESHWNFWTFVANKDSRLSANTFVVSLKSEGLLWASATRLASLCAVLMGLWSGLV